VGASRPRVCTLAHPWRPGWHRPDTRDAVGRNPLCGSARSCRGEWGTLGWVSTRETAHVAFRMARPREVRIPTTAKPAAHSPWRHGGIVLALVATTGGLAMVPWTAPSLASLPGVISGSGPAKVGEAVAGMPSGEQRGLEPSTTTPSRSWPRCPECGVVESVRPIAGPGGPGEHDDANDRAAARAFVAAADRESAARDGYEVTVRFRDGSTTTFGASTPRLWRVGSRVNVIGTPESRP